MSTLTPQTTVSNRPTIPPAGPRFRLSTAGPSGHAQCETTQPVLLIGSRRDCDLPLNDPEVSKIHCAVIHTGRGLLVCDLCSRSGTYLNGAAVRVAALRAGDALRIGGANITLEALPAPAQHAEQPIPRADTPAPRLTLGAHTVDLTAGVVVVGRRRTCDLVLDTPDTSLAHALIFVFDGYPAVCDLGSRSGTFVNGERAQLAWIRGGDHLVIGGETLAVACESGAPAAPPARTTASLQETTASVTPQAHPPASAASDSRTIEHWLRAALSDLAVSRQKSQDRALRLDRRAAELETLATLLDVQSAHLERTKAELAKRAAEVEQAANEARDRLALALSHEQAVTAAWEELDRWHARREAAFQDHLASLPPAPRPKRPGADLPGLPDAPPVARPFPRADTPPPTAPGAGNA
ncbi:MAG TPA: FHA domain-containing protein [Phycisphaerae bacterium]|nr:FHA domain-containing protein [Phycisphaerae bacterium]